MKKTIYAVVVTLGLMGSKANAGIEPARDPSGVPAEQAYAIPQREWRLTGVYFATGSDRLEVKSEAELNETVKILEANPRVAVEIQGYTDNVGEERVNEELSHRRAMAVQQYLIDHGIQASRLRTKGYGESRPIADNDTAEGRAKNRRIELSVLSS